MKAAVQFLPLVALAVVIILGASYFGIGIPTGVLIGDVSCIPAKADFDVIKCDEIGPDVRNNDFAIYGDQRTGNYITVFGDNENSPNGDWLVNCVDASNFAFQYDDPYNTLGVNCDIGSTDWCTTNVNPNQLTRIASDVKAGERIRAGGCYNDYIVTQQFTTGYFYTQWQPFGLTLNGQPWKPTNCMLDYSVRSAVDMCTDPADIEAGLCEDGVVEGSNLGWYQTVSYVSSFTPVLEEGLIMLVDYNGDGRKDEWCDPFTGAIFDMKAIETTGACYAVADNKLGNVECCTGMKAVELNKICVDFRWEPITDDDGDVIHPPDCISDLQCKHTWVPDYTTPENDYFREECIDGTCVRVETKIVECTPPDIGCTDGWVCVNGICEQQIGPTIICGDGVCSAPVEDSENCPQDCENPLTKMLGNLADFAVALLVGFVISGILVFAMRFHPLTRTLVANQRTAIMIVLVMGALLAFLFTAPMLMVASLL